MGSRCRKKKAGSDGMRRARAVHLFLRERREKSQRGELGGFSLASFILVCWACLQRDEAKRGKTNLLLSVALNFPLPGAVLAAVMDIVVRYICI